MTKTPCSLLARLRDPFDPEAWARFVELGYTPLIYSWGRRVGLQDPDAADLVQDVFINLLQVLPTFQYDRAQNFRRWLRTITLNKWRNTRKKLEDQRLRGQHVASRALRLMRADFEEKTWKACWETTALGRPAAEVAAELGMTAGAVYAAKFRVLERLRRELNGLLE